MRLCQLWRWLIFWKRFKVFSCRGGVYLRPGWRQAPPLRGPNLLLKLWSDTTTDPPEGEKDFFGAKIPMGKRRKARELVLQSLYSYEIKGGDAEENLQDFFSKADLDPQAKIFAAELYHKVINSLKDIDSMIESCVKRWDLSRISVVDKNILRMGICEMLFFGDIPKKVSLDEAIELAKKYGGEDSGSFVNGILDAIAQNINAR